jgi:hypothetical protein
MQLGGSPASAALLKKILSAQDRLLQNGQFVITHRNVSVLLPFLQPEEKSADIILPLASSTPSVKFSSSSK